MAELPAESDVVKVLREEVPPSVVSDRQSDTEALISWVNENGIEMTLSGLRRRERYSRVLPLLGWAIGIAQARAQ